jgi:tRNA A58 N-methylase Trm61
MTMIDLGVGTGLFLPYFSNLVGKEGKLFCLDIADKFIEYNEKKIVELKKNEGDSNAYDNVKLILVGHTDFGEIVSELNRHIS